MTGKASAHHRCLTLRLAFGASGLCVEEAEAHLVTTGVGPVYDGVAHFVLTPESFLPVIGLAILAGLRGSAHGRWVLLILPALWFIGGVCGAITGRLLGEPIAIISLLATGGFAAADLPLPLWATALLAALTGFALGYADGSILPLDGTGARILLGMVGAVFVTFALTVMLILPLRSRAARIAMRVLGSWIAASGLLLFGWWLRSGSPFNI